MRYLRCLGMTSVWILTVWTAGYAGMTALPQAEIDHLGEFIFANECDQKEECLTAWNEGEAFPSLGIGHFIWYPAGSSQSFEESFPKLMHFIRRKGVVPPAEAEFLNQRHAPWKNREEFYEAVRHPEGAALRAFLSRTKAYQAEFIIDRFIQAIPKLLSYVPRDDQTELRHKLTLMIQAPGGLYPLVDYVNFNGEGISSGERYYGQGWGLLQVLEAMDREAAERNAIQEFARAAVYILERRVANSPRDRFESRWLPGWKKRMQTYLTAAMHSDIRVDPLIKKQWLDSVFAEADRASSPSPARDGEPLSNRSPENPPPPNL